MTLHEAHVAHRRALCGRAFRALARTDAAWCPEMAPLTMEERAIVTSALKKERERTLEIAAP